MPIILQTWGCTGHEYLSPTPRRGGRTLLRRYACHPNGEVGKYSPKERYNCLPSIGRQSAVPERGRRWSKWGDSVHVNITKKIQDLMLNTRVFLFLLPPLHGGCLRSSSSSPSMRMSSVLCGAPSWIPSPLSDPSLDKYKCH